MEGARADVEGVGSWLKSSRMSLLGIEGKYRLDHLNRLVLLVSPSFSTVHGGSSDAALMTEYEILVATGSKDAVTSTVTGLPRYEAIDIKSSILMPNPCAVNSDYHNFIPTQCQIACLRSKSR
jgi:hypothetical protein